jgi:hypothetical protein
MLSVAGVSSSDGRLNERRRMNVVLHPLEAEGIPIQERTLGGCLAALRSANDKLRKGGLNSLPERTAARVREVHRFFSDEVPFMKDLRDKAAHGNRDALLKDIDFYKCRSAILNKKLLSVIVGL